MTSITKKSFALVAIALAMILSACGKKAPLDDPLPREEKQSFVTDMAPNA